MEPTNKTIIKRNLWESNFADKYHFFKDIESYFNFLLENNLNLSFSLKEKFTPGNVIESVIDNIGNKNNIEISYTDESHPIAIPKDTDFTIFSSYIHPSFFEKHKDEFIKFAQNKLLTDLNNNKISISIEDYALTDELFEEILTNEAHKEKFFYYRVVTDNNLTEEQIKRIKDNHLEFTINGKEKEKISSKYIINYYTIKALKEIKHISIDIPIDFDPELFKYINESAEININLSNTEKIDEEYKFNEIKKIVNILSTHNHKYNIKFSVDNRELLRKSNLLNSLPNNISLSISISTSTYDIDTYQKEEAKLEKLIAPIRDSNLSPLEKYLAVYNIVKQFKPYKENENNKDEARQLRYILDNEYIVCTGFANLLEDLLNRVGISNKKNNLEVDISYDKGFSMEEININHSGHARNIIKLDDDKYNIHGYYVVDATWDNEMELDLYLNSLMTFDKKKEAKRLEKLTDDDLLLDFHNFDEFLEKLNYLLKKEMNNNFITEKTTEKRIIKVYKNTFEKIMKILQKTDYEKYTEFYNKYNKDFSNTSINLKELESICNNMLTEYAKYIIPLSNNNVPLTTILKAATVVKKEIDGLGNEEIKEWLETSTNINQKEEKKSFPYKYDPNNHTEAYLETKEIQEETKKITR